MRSALRSLGILLIAMVLLASFVSFSLADEKASATKRVIAIVKPNIGVGAAAVKPVEVQTGKFKMLIPFRVDANKQIIHLQVCVTNLYKADDPTSEHFIPVDNKKEVSVVPTNGIELGDRSNSLPYDGRHEIGDFEGYITEDNEFESSQRGRFSQDVIVDPWWVQGDDELPTGEYSGFVQLIAWIDP